MRVFTQLKTAALIVLVTLAFLPNQIFTQTTGSIGGSVIDEKDKAPLVGAIVKIEGTQRGAETDANGEFVILNVDVGTYNIIASYVGYTSSRQTGVKVSVDLRTRVNFELTSGAVVIDTLEIVAQRKGIDVEQSGRLVTEQQIENTGIRGIQNIVAQTSGVIQSLDETGRQSIYIRGSRRSENLIVVDGVSTTNPIDGSSTAYVSNSQLKEISVLTGGFGAEYGNALAGVINVTTKSGTSNYAGSAEVLSDAVAGNWISTTVQGYNLYNLNIGGPLVPTKGLAKVINFYGGAERQFLQVSQPSWIDDKLFENGQIPNYPLYQWSYNGRLSIDLNEIKGAKVPIELKGGFNLTDKTEYSFQSTFLKYDSQRWRYNDNKDLQIYGRLVHNVSSKFFYEAQFNYYRTKGEFGDPLYRANYFLVGDTAFVPNLKTMGAELPLDPTGVFRQAGAPYNFFQRTDASYVGGKLDATLALLTKNFGDHEIKFGGEFRYNTLKKMLFYSPAVATNNYARPDTLSASDLKKFIQSQINLWYSGSGARLKGYGYQIVDRFGNQIVTGDDANAKHPIVGAFYIRDKADFPDFSFNGGIRIDYLDVNSEVLKSIYDVVGNDGVLLSDDDYQKSKPTVAVSPRLGFSFPVTDKTVFVAQYGKFIQMPPLDYLYLNRVAFSEFFKTSLQDVAENSSLTPEKLTSYEVGIKQTVGDYLNMGLTVYYKETQDQIGIYKVIASERVPIGYTIYMNSDFAVSRGIDFYLSLRRFNRLAVDVAYTLLYASGTGSDPNQKLNLVNQQTVYPNFTFPLNYDQRHTGSINLDYRFGGDNDVPKGWFGQVLKNLGLNVLFSFNSGKPYTSRLLPPNAFDPTSGLATSSKNAVYTSWNYSIDLKLDKTVNIWKTNWNFYIWVTNLLNSELINRVWEATGRPDDDGYLNTPAAANATPEYIANYKLRIQNPINWGPPRQVRFGIKLSF
jgi:outer membrane receptor protein involved in Fe transport